MKLPRPIKWACGTCGAEMQVVGPDLIACSALFCSGKSVPFKVEYPVVVEGV